jgi:small subunit ribosomal protein S7
MNNVMIMKTKEEKLEEIRKKAKELERKLKQREARTIVKKEVKEEPKKEKVKLPPVKLFDKWNCNIEINDPGLRRYVTLNEKILPRSAGTYRQRFHKSKAHIIERLAMHLMVPGHMGKRHRLSSGKFGGSFNKTMKIVEHALQIMEEKEKKNPVEIFVRALENAGPREEIMSYQMGSIVARDAVVTAPQRRIDKALRLFAQGAYRKSFSKKKKMEQALAEELLAAYNNSADSLAIKEKERIEREAGGAR